MARRHVYAFIGGDGGLIDNNIFNDCTVGIFFDQSDWLVDSSQLGSPDDRVTQQMHDDNGSDQFVISNNVFQVEQDSASGLLGR